MDLDVDHLFRQQSGRMVSTLTRIFGSNRLQLAEEVTQDALVKALELWPFEGVPENPQGWLMQVAKNRALDAIRREASLAEKMPALLHAFGGRTNEQSEADPFPDDELCMMFLCCHPRLGRDTRVALTLKTVAGFSVREIARAFLAPEPAIAQKLVRGKRQIRDERLSFEMPEEKLLAARLDSVLEVLYLLFNEGYAAHAGEWLLRTDLCEEAIRLARLAASHPAAGAPKCHALLALMLLQASRLSARVDEAGDLFLLRDQDRARWDRRRIAKGLLRLERAAEGDEVSTYHLQAGIAAVHAAAPTYAETDWAHITELYDRLHTLTPGPVIALNRAIALSRWKGPQAGLIALAAIEREPALSGYHLLPAAMAELWSEAGDSAKAARYYRAALACRCSDPERRFLERRLAEIL